MLCLQKELSLLFSSTHLRLRAAPLPSPLIHVLILPAASWIPSAQEQQSLSLKATSHFGSCPDFCKALRFLSALGDTED